MHNLSILKSRDAESLPQWKIWLLAARPRTLTASLVPVFIGIGSAMGEPLFSWTVAFIILSTAVLIQIATNFVNDLADFKRGADTAERVGPLRVTQAGLVSETQMRRASLILLGTALLLGCYLVSVGGAPILLIGLLSLLGAVCYTAGPWPLAYLGLGDLFVLLFFGPVAVSGTYYLLSGTFTLSSALIGLCPGMIATGILVVNNLRDRETDAKSGKRTLAVRLGARFARVEYAALIVGAALLPPLLTWWSFIPRGTALASLYLAAALPVLATVLSPESRGSELNRALEHTGKLLALFGVLYLAGLAL